MKISIVVATKDRYLDLLECLGSLLAQSIMIDELVIVDNNSQDDTSIIVKSFAKNVKFPVKYVLEKNPGFPVVYNRGLKAASHNWVVFLSDDCVVDEEWLKVMKKAIAKNTTVAAISGQTKTYFYSNFFSSLTSFREGIWKAGAIQGKKILDLEILDTRNITYNSAFLKKHGLSFDEKYRVAFNGSNEDCDLGMQIASVGGRAIYEQGAIAWHKDPTSLSEYYQKLVFISRAHALYERRWLKERKKEKHQKKDRFWRLKYLLSFLVEKKMFPFTWIFFLVHIFFSYLVVKCSKIYQNATA